MNNIQLNQLTEDGYTIIKNCIDKKLIDNIRKNINESLIKILKKNKINFTKDFVKNYYNVRKLISQHEIQVRLAKKLIDDNLIEKIFLEKIFFKELIILLGPDLEYYSGFELSINDKNSKDDDYLVKKYHQEFWSGVGIEGITCWIPIYLLKGMGTIEIIKKSHTWGHIPHRNRAPIEIPKKHETKIIDINEGSVVLLSALTLHRTVWNKHKNLRIALPVLVRNFYYPNTGNLDLFNFKKFNFSFFSKLRRILGNPHYSPFRTLGQKRTDLFKKDDYSKK